MTDGFPEFGREGRFRRAASSNGPFPDAAHPFRAPGPKDFRGPCPALNTAANHGYLPRNGIATFDQLVQMQTTLFNIGVDVATFLAAVGIFFDGDFTTMKMSIGGNTTKTSLTNSVMSFGLNYHPTLESDGSPSREDYFLNNGDGYSFKSNIFALTNKAANTYGKGTFNFTTMTETAYQSIQRSIALNDQFFFGINQFLFHYAAHLLYGRTFPNGTDGIASKKMIYSFIGVVDQGNGAFSHIPERIPSRWYRRPTPFTLVNVLSDILAMQAAHPVSLGANAGKNNYVPANLNSTNGIKPLPPNLDVRTLGCIIYQAVVTLVPSTVGRPLLKAILDPIFVTSGTFNCSSLFLGPYGYSSSR